MEPLADFKLVENGSILLCVLYQYQEKKIKKRVGGRKLTESHLFPTHLHMQCISGWGCDYLLCYSLSYMHTHT